MFGRREIGLSTRYWLGRILKGRDHLEDLNVSVRVIKTDLEDKGVWGMDCSNFAEDRDK